MAATASKKTGRPVIETPELKAAVTEDYGKCGSMRLVADLHGISVDTIHRWVQNDQSFADDLQRVRGAKAMHHVGALNARDETKVDTWWLSRLYREDYSEQRNIELTGANGGPIQVASMAAIIIADASVGAAYDQLLDALARTDRDGEPGGIALGRNAQEPHTVEAVPPPRGPRSRTAKGSRRKN